MREVKYYKVLDVREYEEISWSTITNSVKSIHCYTLILEDECKKRTRITLNKDNNFGWSEYDTIVPNDKIKLTTNIEYDYKFSYQVEII